MDQLEKVFADALRDRAAAAARVDLTETLRLDDLLEDFGMHGDDRLTCYSCQSWANHRHNPLTGARID